MRALMRSRRSSVSLEFAFVAIPFLIALLGTFEAAYDLYAQAALYYTTRDIGRAIFAGTLQSAGTVSSASFVSGGACSLTASLLNCNNLYVNAQVVPTTSEFWTTQPVAATSGSTLIANTWTVCTGGSTAAVVLTTAYASPAFLGSLVPGFSIANGGQRVHVTTARLAFINYGFTQTSAC